MPKIDWVLLREQKAALLRAVESALPVDTALLEGLVFLLDEMQDQALCEGFTEAEIFGEDHADL